MERQRKVYVGLLDRCQGWALDVDCPSDQSATADSATATAAGSGPQSAAADSPSAGGAPAPESQGALTR
ncbi:MAG: hypothetical protein ACRDPG_05355 [Nocardioidaceae bacterium]